MSKDRPEEKRDLFTDTGELKGVYDLSMARARALEHAQKSFGKTVKGKHIPLIWDVEKAAFNEDDDCFDIVLSCHPEEGEYLRKGEWVYHVSPKGQLLPGTPLLRSSLRLKEEARKLSPLLLAALAAVVLLVVVAAVAFAGGMLSGWGVDPAPTATPTVAAVALPTATARPTSTPVPASTRLPATASPPTAAQPPTPVPPTATPFIQVGPGFVPFPTPTPTPRPTPVPTATPTRAPATPTPPSAVPVVLASDAYVDQANQFSLRYPQGWQKLSATGAAAAFMVPQPDAISATQQFNTNINVIIDTTSAATLDDYVSASSAAMKQVLTNYQEVSRRQVTLGGVPAYLLESTFDQGGFSLHILQAVLLKGNNAYIVTGTTHISTWGQYKDLLEASLRSFRLIAAPTPTPAPASLTGFWRGTITNITSGQTAPFDLQLQESGAVTIALSGYGRVSPPLVGEGPIRGQRAGNQVVFDTTYSYLGFAFIGSFEGTLSPDRRNLSGTYRVSPTGEVGTWQVTRVE